MKKILKHLKENWIRHGFETLVVTIGILGAFTLNNWNENRKSRILEKDYLVDVHEEFKDNKKQFERILLNFSTQLACADTIMDLLPITEGNWDYLRGYYFNAFNPGSFDPSKSSIDVLINSGRIDLVQNDSLKKLLLSWTDQFEDYKEEEEFIGTSRDRFLDIYINESSYPNFSSDEIVYPLSKDLRIKLEKLMAIRQTYLRLVLSEIPDQTESDQLMKSIYAIISLTVSYNE